MLIQMVTGEIFTSPAQTPANPVHGRGVIGKGLAHAFAARSPAMYAAYCACCAAAELQTGVVHLYAESAPWILNFTTKEHWRAPTRLQYIVAGLQAFVTHHVRWGVASVAFPQSGGGKGGLAWGNAEPVMRQYLAPLSIPVEIYRGPDAVGPDATGQVLEVPLPRWPGETMSTDADDRLRIRRRAWRRNGACQELGRCGKRIYGRRA